MDDFLVLTRTRWQLRRCVKRLHEFFDLGGFETHPDKTQLGRIEHGFDWLGVWFTPTGGHHSAQSAGKPPCTTRAALRAGSNSETVINRD
jgi:hypothetical protein